MLKNEKEKKINTWINLKSTEVFNYEKLDF